MNNEIVTNFETLYSNFTEMVILVSEKFSILAVNNTLLDTLSFSKDEILNESISSICCNETLKKAIQCGRNNFNASLCSKYKNIVVVDGKLDFIIINDEKTALIKLFRVSTEILPSLFTDNNESRGCCDFIKNVDGRYILNNDEFIDHFNMDVVDKFDYQVWDKDFYEEIKKEDLYVIDNKKSCIVYKSEILEDKIHYFEVIKRPIFDDNKDVVAIRGNIRDITESVNLNNELVIQNEQLSILYKILNNSTSKNNLRSLFSSIYTNFKTLLNIDNMVIFLYNPEIDKLEYCASYGFRQDYSSLYKNKTKYMEFINNVFMTGKPVQMSDTLNHDDETAKQAKLCNVHYCACYPLVYNDEGFGVIYFDCNSGEYSRNWDNKFMDAICKNISILLQNAILYTKLEENLNYERETNEQIGLYFDTIIDFLCILDKQACFKKIGKHMLETLGFEEEELMFSSVKEIIVEEDEKSLLGREEYFAKEGNTEFMTKVLSKNKEERVVDWNVKYLKDREVYICSGRDLTHKKDMEKKEKLVEESYQLEKLKSEFLSKISHELRTPLAVISGSILNIQNMLSENNVNMPEKSFECINSIKTNTDRLTRLFDNILEIMNANAGFANLNLRSCNIINVLEDKMLSLADYLRKYDISLIFDTEIEERYLNTDPAKIEKIILNIVSNAVKYSKKNVQTEIFVKVYEDDEKVYLSIKDNGIGISAKNLDKIFDKFSQADDCMTRSAEGSGTGLHLVKIMLQILKADIKVYSKLGEGSEFIIEFPIDHDLKIDPYDEKIFDDFGIIMENLEKEFSDISMSVKL